MQLKASDEPYNEGLLTSGCAAWFYRTGFFSIRGSMGINNDLNDGLGSPCRTDETGREAIARVIGLEKAHIMSGLPPGGCTVETAISGAIKDITNALTSWVGVGE